MERVLAPDTVSNIEDLGQVHVQEGPAVSGYPVIPVDSDILPGRGSVHLEAQCEVQPEPEFPDADVRLYSQPGPWFRLTVGTCGEHIGADGDASLDLEREPERFGRGVLGKRQDRDQDDANGRYGFFMIKPLCTIYFHERPGDRFD